MRRAAALLRTLGAAVALSAPAMTHAQCLDRIGLDKSSMPNRCVEQDLRKLGGSWTRLSEGTVPLATYHYDHSAVTIGKAGLFMKRLLH